MTARQLGVAAVIVRPCDVDSAQRFLGLGAVQLASVAGYPYGISNTAVKLYEARDLLRRGVRELYVYPNPGRLLSRQFQHQEIELVQIAEACAEAGAALKVVVDNLRLNDEMKIIVCRMAKRVAAHAVAAVEPRDLALLMKHCSGRVLLESGARNLEEARTALAAGCVRLWTAHAAEIIAELARERQKAAGT